MGFLFILPNFKKINGFTIIVVYFPGLQRKSSVWPGSLCEDKVQEAGRTHAGFCAQILSSFFYISFQGSVI